MFTIDINKTNKILYIVIEGFIKSEEAKSYILELEEKIASIDTTEYHLIIDTKNVLAAPTNSTNFIKDSMDILSNKTFKNAIRIVPQSVVAYSQVIRLNKDESFYGKVTQVESYEKALEFINENTK
jgi:hypothetical protein